MVDDIRDRRKKAKDDDEKLEEGLEESFPASDPPSMAAPRGHMGKPYAPRDEPKKRKKKSKA